MSNEEKERIYNEVIEWIESNPDQFRPNCKIVYDKKNLDRMKRFANSPMGYIDERTELNKEVFLSYGDGWFSNGDYFTVSWHQP